MIVYVSVKMKELDGFEHYRLPCFNTIELANSNAYMVLDSVRTSWSENRLENGIIEADYRIEMNLCEDNCEYEAVENENDYIDFLKNCKINDINWDFAEEDEEDYEIVNQTLEFELCNTDYSVIKNYNIKA